MDAIKHALQEQLEETIERLKGQGGAVVFEDYPGALEDDRQGDVGSDGASIGGERLLAFAVPRPLGERASRAPGDPADPPLRLTLATLHIGPHSLAPPPTPP